MADRASEQSIFLHAIGLEAPADRSDYLDKACGNDPALRAELDALLAAHGRLGGAPPAWADVAVGPDATVDVASAVVNEHVGAVIGSYKLVEQIGEGGMGLVYMAEQERPLRRLVALKIIKPGMDSRQVLARFEAEKQALAMMDHENIAKVFDAGTTEAGHPYFVMELVRGIPIDAFSDQKRLTIRERLELFIQVCQAVQHAHQKGIIHRDLKPSNVLVTMHDVRAVPKVIDFGIAKALGASLTEQTLHTGFAQLVGTPLYMSPEQAEMNQLGVDTRSDVYSLGVLLYELLTGTTPFDKEVLSGSGLEEMRRMIREDEPPRPSARVSTLHTQAPSTSAQGRSGDPRHISATLRGELDWIVMKALEKDRGRRYESAGAFATDVQRYLDDEPVLACPPSTMYKFHKFARKHRAALATAVAIAASLILGTTASAWQAVRATTAEAQANANASRAQEKAQEATTQRDLAQKQRDEVQALNDKLAAKEQQLQRTLYASDMNLAQNAWEAGDIRRVRELVERHRPHPGESDLRHFEWHYLNRLCHQELLTLHERSGRVYQVAFSSDGKRLASTHGGNKLVVAVRDAQTGRELLTLEGAGGPVAFSPDGKRLAAVGTDYTLTAKPTPEEIKKSRAGRHVKIWDVQTGQVILSFKGLTGAVYSLAFSPDGKRLACGSATVASTSNRVFGAGEVKVWDVQTGRELLVLKHTGSVSVAYSPDGKRLASSGQKPAGEPLAGAVKKSGPNAGANVAEVKVWDAETGQEVFTVEAPARSLNHGPVAYSPDGKRLIHVCVSGYRFAKSSSTMTVWDAETGRELLTQKTDGQVACVAFSPDGKRFVTGAGWTSSNGDLINRAVRVWDAETGQELYSLKGHAADVISVAFSPDGSRLASASRDGTVKVWDATTSQEARAVLDGDLSPDGKHRASSAGNEVKVWDTQTGRDNLTLTGHTGRVQSFAFSPDGGRLVSAAADRTVKVWDIQTGRETRTLTGHTGRVESVAFSPDGRRLVSAAADRTVKLWDAQTGHELRTFKGFAGPVEDGDSDLGGMGPVVVSPDGRRVASGNRFGVGEGARTAWTAEVRMWDAQTGREVVTYKRDGGSISSVVFSPDGKRLVCATWKDRSGGDGDEDGEVKVWDAETGQELHTLPAASGHRVVFSPDGRRIAGAGKPPIAQPRQGPSSSGEVKVWDVETGRELVTLQGHTSDVGRVVFSPDGQRLASGSWFDERVRLWDAETGQQLLALKGQASHVAFSGDGHWLVGCYQLWDATPLPEK